MQVGGHACSSHIEKGRCEVNVRHHLRHDGAGLEQLRAMQQQRHAHGRLVSRALVNQPVLTEVEAVVAHVNHQRRVEQLALREPSREPPHTVVHAEQRLAVAAMVRLEVEVRQVVAKVHAVPAVALVPHPHRLVEVVLRRVGEGLRRREGFARVTPLMPVRCDEVRVHRLVRDIGEEGLARLPSLQPVQREVRQLVGDVAALRDTLAVHIVAFTAGLRHHACRAASIGPVVALPLERNPVVEPALRRVRLAHVPLAEERRLVSRALEELREEHETGADGIVVVHHAMRMRVKPGEDARATRRAQRRGDEGVPAMHPTARESVQMRRLQIRMPHEGHGIVAMVVRKDEEDVAGCGKGAGAPECGEDQATKTGHAERVARNCRTTQVLRTPLRPEGRTPAGREQLQSSSTARSSSASVL